MTDRSSEGNDAAQPQDGNEVTLDILCYPSSDKRFTRTVHALASSLASDPAMEPDFGRLAWKLLRRFPKARVAVVRTNEGVERRFGVYAFRDRGHTREITREAAQEAAGR